MPIVDQTNEEYHAGEGASKSKLWTAWKRTPHHARYGKKKETAALDVGKAAHIAILEPELLDASVTCGPADRRGNKWKEAQDFANAAGTLLLTEGDYETMLVIRDLAATVPEVEIMQRGNKMVETSAYHVDEKTGLLLKTRPDIYNADLGIIGDVKNMADASPEAFKRDVGKYGYHMQHAVYSDVWTKGAGMPVDGFFFIVFEKSDPPMVACYELTPSAIAEGYAQYRAAVELWAECEAKNEWPGYPSGVQKIGLRRFDYLLTPPPQGDELSEEADAEELEDIPGDEDAEG